MAATNPPGKPGPKSGAKPRPTAKSSGNGKSGTGPANVRRVARPTAAPVEPPVIAAPEPEDDKALTDHDIQIIDDARRQAIMGMSFAIGGIVASSIIGPLLSAAIGGSILMLVSLAAPIVAIILGTTALKATKPYINVGVRGYAIAAIVIGSVHLGTYVLAILFFLLVFLICAASCGNAGSESSSSESDCDCSPELDCFPDCNGCVISSDAVHGALSTLPFFATRASRQVVRQNWLAHHPNHSDFQHDVLHIKGTRVCAGCVGLYSGGIAAMIAFAFASIAAPWLALGLGTVLIGTQGISALGWSRTVWSKLAIKASVGFGAVLSYLAIHELPISVQLRTLLVFAFLFIGWVSLEPRRKRMALWHQQHHGH